MTCPITRGCYSVLVQHFFEGSRKFLYADVEPQFNELKAEITDDEPDRMTRLLRGFFALELVYQLLVPSVTTDLRLLASYDALTKKPFERSHQGMDELLETLQRFKRRIYVDVGVLDLTNTTSSQETKNRQRQMKRALPTLENIEEMTQQMKSGLDDRSKLTRVGECFAGSLLSCEVAAERCLDYMRTILTITPDNPVSTWTTNSQA